MRSKYLFSIAAAATLLNASSAGIAGSAVPSLKLKRGEPYSRARATLLKQGWMPFRTKGDHGTAIDEMRAGWAEIFFCSGTGRNFCTFIWKRYAHCALITTVGEFYRPENAEPSVWQAETGVCRAILKRA